MAYTLPDLEYDYDALQPSISGAIMRLHHTKHHKAYVDKLNEALEGIGLVDTYTDSADLLRHLGDLPDSVRIVVRNNGGGHYNHSLFWRVMTPNKTVPSDNLIAAIESRYDSYDELRAQFTQAGLKVFGSGWVWLMPDLSIITTANQDNPLMDGGPEPLLGLDVWEHAYYLDYKNVRADYIAQWWDVINWAYVSERFEQRNA